jgi:hypothetical protein
MVLAAMALVVFLSVVAVILIHAAGRARARALAEEIRAHVEPYLRRRAAEAGLPAAAPVWTSRTQPEEIIGYARRTAERLLEAERSGKTTPGIEYAHTQPHLGSEHVKE